MRLSERNGLKVKTVNGKQLIENQELLKQFADIYNSRAKEIKSEQHSYKELLHMCKSYGEKLWLLYIENPTSNSGMVMASFFLQTKDIFHYWHNGSTQEGRKLFAPTLIIAEGIKFGQKLRCKIIDFEGIYDERFVEQTKRWKGFTKFKEGFNGEKVIFARPYIKYYSPVLTVFHFFKMI